MDHHVVVDDTAEATVLHVVGDLDFDSADGLRAVIFAALDGPQRHVVVDLARLAAFDSSGLSALIAGERRARERGGWLRLAAVPPLAARLLETTDVIRLLPTYSSVDEARLAQPP